MERGNLIHKLAEDYTLGKIKKLPPELRYYDNQFAELKKSKPQVEQTWAFTKPPHPWRGQPNPLSSLPMLGHASRASRRSRPAPCVSGRSGSQA